MKKIYVLFASVVISLSAVAQNLPNWGFENWNNDTMYVNLNDWLTNIDDNGASPDINNYMFWNTDATDGTYSLYLESYYDENRDDTNMTYAIQGQLDDGPSGGIPYTSDIDSITGYYQSDLPAGDSAIVLVVLYSPTDTVWNIFRISGTTSGWTRFSYPIDSLAGMTEVFFGFASGDFEKDSTIVPGSWIMFDNISFVSNQTTPAPIPNYSFENWYTVTLELLQDWWSLDQISIYVDDNLGSFRSNNAFLGNSSLYLESVAVSFGERDSLNNKKYSDTIGAVLVGNVPPGDSGIPAGISYSGVPYSLSGYYIGQQLGNDSSGVGIVFFSPGDTTEFEFKLGKTSEWTRFDFDLTAMGTTVTWDSIAVYLISSSGEYKELGSAVWFDEVQLIDTGCAYSTTAGSATDASKCTTGSAALDAGTGNEFLWSTGETTQTISASTSGDYIVRVKDGNGCYIYNIISVADTGACQGVGIAEKELVNPIEIFPNPASDYITITPGDPDLQIKRLEIVNLLGQVELTENWNLKSSQKNVSLKGLVSGIYFVKVYTRDNQTQLYKFYKN